MIHFISWCYNQSYRILKYVHYRSVSNICWHKVTQEISLKPISTFSCGWNYVLSMKVISAGLTSRTYWAEAWPHWGGGRGDSTKFYIGCDRGSAPRSVYSPLPFCISFWKKSYPFYRLSHTFIAGPYYEIFRVNPTTCSVDWPIGVGWVWIGGLARRGGVGLDLDGLARRGGVGLDLDLLGLDWRC